MRLIATMAASAVFLVGCAAQQQRYWAKHGATQSEFQRDNLTCRQYGMQSAVANGMTNNMFVEIWIQRESANCLRLLGYTQQATPPNLNAAAPQPAAPQPAAPQPAAPQPAVTTQTSGYAVTSTPPSPSQQTARKIGKSSFTVEKLARSDACHETPIANLSTSGSGFEVYSVACVNGDVAMYRCEFGNCRLLK